MASITERGPFQFQVTIRRKGYKSQTSKFESRGDAEAWAKEIEAKMFHGRFLDDRLARTTTLDACLARYATEVTPDKKGAAQEASKINVIRRHPIAKLNMAEVRSANVANYIQDRTETVSGGTVARELCIYANFRLSMVDRTAPVSQPQIIWPDHPDYRKLLPRLPTRPQ